MTPLRHYLKTRVSNPITVFLSEGCSFKASPPSVSPGQPITVTFTANGACATLKDWVGLLRAGATDRQWIDYQYTGGATGSTFTLAAPQAAEEYEFRCIYNDRFTDLARSTYVLIGDGVYSISVSPTSANRGGSIDVRWAAPAGTSSTGLDRPILGSRSGESQLHLAALVLYRLRGIGSA